MNLKIAQVIGLNTDQKAAQVISSSRNGDNFFAVLDLTCDDAFTRGRQILSDLADFYFEETHFDFEGSSGEKLTATFNAAREKFADTQYSLLLAAGSGKALFLIFSGEMEAYLKREGRLSPLLAIGSPSQLISGFLQERDRLFFSTKSLNSFLAQDLEKLLDLPADVFEQEVTDRIGVSNLENQGLAGLAVSVEPDLAQSEKIEAKQESEVEQETVIPPSTYSEESPGTGNFTKQAVAIPLILKNFLFRYFPRSGKVRLIMAVILIAVVALGVGLKIKADKDQARDAAFNQALTRARDDFSAAKGLSFLNPAEAKGKLDSAKQNLNQALSLKPKEGEALNLKKQIEDESGSILQQSEASQFPLFLDLDLIKKDFRTESLSLSDGKILALDTAVKTLVVVDLAKKSNQILAGENQLGEATLSSLNGSLAFVFSKDKGILRVDTAGQKISSVSKPNEDWGQIADLTGFAGNVYLLDQSQIWKYLPTSDGYSDKREYLNKGVKADFAGSLRMQIESSIYVLKPGGEILRFTRGDKDNFALEGLDKPLKDPKSIFTSSDTDNLYVLDSGNSRVLILTKTGKYKGQITGEKFGVATDLVVDEKEKKVYLLEGSKIFQVDLK